MPNNKVTEPVFMAARQYFDKGYSIKEVSKILQISDVTAGRMKRSGTFGDYKNIIAGHHPTSQMYNYEKETIEICGLVIEISIKAKRS